MITLTLVHRIPHLPSQSWTFEDIPVIRIGRALDNDVILHSAVVSRHHLELQRWGCKWKIINLGGNGTYLDDHPITETLLVNNTVVRLARSGPQLQIYTGATNFKNVPKTPSAEGIQLC